MRMLLAVFLVVTLITACDKRDKKTPVILSEKKMQQVIWDLMVVDEFANTHISLDTMKNLNQERLQLYLKVFQVHKISKEDFNASLKHYSSKPDQMKVIFDSLSSKGELQRRKLIPLN